VNRARLAEAFRRTYLRIDPRSLALGRIAIGLVLIADLLRRIPWLRDFYSNAGLIPNHTVLWRPPFPRIFSVFFMASLPEESALLFLFAFVCFFCLLIGYRTKLFHVLSFAMTTSLHNRIIFAENWGGVAMGVLIVWTAFLPLGRRFSVDALLASLRSRPHETPEELAAGVPPPDDRPMYASLAVLGLLLQIAVIYGFNYLHKSGLTWRNGTAVHYVLYQERIITWLGVWVREHLPFSFTKLLTYGTLVVEAAAPILVLTPIFWRWTRFVAALLLVGLHTSIALVVNLGIFSAAMLAFQPFLITEAQWQLFARWVPQRGRARTVFYDADCGVCTLVVRVLSRMDVHRRLRWISNRDLAALPAGFDPAPLEQTILVVDRDAPDRRWTRADAFAEIFAALPFGRWWSWPLRLPLVRTVAGRGYDLIARHRTAISTWMGLAACGVPSPSSPKGPVAVPTPLRAWLTARLPFAREIGAALVLVTLAADVTVANPAIPSALRIEHRPEWMVAAVMYPHLFEGWSLFSPEAPLTDETVYVDAVTRDGRHVDPYNEIGSRVATVPIDDVPVRLGHSSFWCDYTLRIPETAVLHQALIEWILRYPERTGQGADTLVKFDAYVVEHDSPGPGETEPQRPRKRRFLSWP
jgi:predicted DCC family thiol-disulfide oxidoreductase YuxK